MQNVKQLAVSLSLFAWLAGAMACGQEVMDGNFDPDSFEELEELEELEGELEVILGSIMTPEGLQVAQTEHYLNTDAGEQLELVFSGDEPWLEGGTRLRVTGERQQEPNRFMVDDEGWTIIAPPNDNATQMSTVEHQVAAILVNFQNDTREPFTPSEIRKRLFTNTDSARAFYEELSNDRWTLRGKYSSTGDVFGWYTIPHSASGERCNNSTWRNAALAAAQADGVDLSGYRNILLIYVSCGACALASLNGTYSYYNGASSCVSSSVMVHELGHNYGLHHASSLRCHDDEGRAIAFGDSCRSTEYGDRFDSMGASSSRRLFNAFHRGRLGLFSSSNTRTVGQGTTVTSVVPLAPASSGVKALRVPRGDGTFFYVEYRRPYGQFDDSGVTGVGIRIAPEYTTLAQPLKLDMTPETESREDAQLPVGKTFMDHTSSIRIKLRSASSSRAEVEVHLPSVLMPTPNAPRELRMDGLSNPLNDYVSVKLAWDAPLGSVNVSEYVIDARQAPDGEWVEAGRTKKETFYAHVPLVELATTSFRVRAENSVGGWSPPSNTICLTATSSSTGINLDDLLSQECRTIAGETVCTVEVTECLEVDVSV